ncbi:Thioredoxin-1 [Corynebacterium urogenitale]|uniref:Thioredoxin n=1 Tax=Corynebacterium urogenitale TaxID=2487892 RepID=A0A5J6ZAX4_9CORY|nr:thioredoxin [Corynebacterium urogenitale]QFQ03431.1 Thioredoxin-1 [Corynebacterium urogenitale]
MADIQKVTQATFKEVVTESDKPVLVDFWAEWCRPCHMMNPALEELAEEFDGKAVIAKVNVDEERGLGAMFQIMSIPALFIFKDGEKVEEFVGVQPKDTLKAKLESFI